MGVVNFPFTIEGPSFATGALKVNPAYRETNNYQFNLLKQGCVIIKKVEKNTYRGGKGRWASSSSFDNRGGKCEKYTRWR